MAETKETHIHSLVRVCCSTMRDENDEFDADDVFRCMQRRFPVETRQYGEAHIKQLMLGIISRELKRAAGTEDRDEFEQLTIAGIERIPKTLSFYDGERVRFISMAKAKVRHLRSAQKLRENARDHSDRMARKIGAILDFCLAHGGEDVTVAEAQRNAEQVA